MYKSGEYEEIVLVIDLIYNGCIKDHYFFTSKILGTKCALASNPCELLEIRTMCKADKLGVFNFLFRLKSPKSQKILPYVGDVLI